MARLRTAPPSWPPWAIRAPGILRAVVKGPQEGTPAGDLQARLDIPASTLSHHLATLSQAGLVTAERQGTFLLYRAEFKALRALTDFIWEDCCGGGACC